MPIVHDARQRRVPSQHYERELQKVSRQLRTTPGDFVLQINGDISERKEAQARVTAGEGETRLTHIFLRITAAHTNVVLNVAMQILCRLTIAAVQQLWLTHANEMWTQATNCELANLRRIHRQQATESEVERMLYEFHQPCGHLEAEQQHHLTYAAATIEERQFDCKQYNCRHNQNDYSEQNGGYGILTKGITYRLVRAEETAPKGFDDELAY